MSKTVPIRSRSRSQRATSLSLVTLVAASSFTGLAAGSLAPAVAAPSAPAVTADTCETSIAFVIDTSGSYSLEEFEAQKQAVKDTIEALAKDPSMTPTISVYNFARQGETRDVEIRASDGNLYESLDHVSEAGLTATGANEEIPEHNRGIIDLAADDPALMERIDGITQDKGVGAQDSAANWNAVIDGRTWVDGSFGTNWDSGLAQLEGKGHDTIIFASDGQPNMVEGMKNNWEFGTADENFTVGTEEAAAAAVERAEALRGEGAQIIPLYVETTAETITTPEGALSAMKAMTGKGDAAEAGRDYYEIGSAAEMGDALLEAAVSSCSPVTQIDKTLTEGADLALVPGDTVTYDVTVKATGNYPSKQVVVSDLGGAGLTDVKIDEVSAGEVNAEGLWNIGQMDQGTEVTATVTATISDDFVSGSELINDINVSTQAEPEAPTEGSPNVGVDEDDDRFDREVTVTEVIPPQPADVKVDKELSEDGAVAVGDEVSYRVEAFNDSETAAKNVVVTDEIGEGLKIESLSIEDLEAGADDEAPVDDEATDAPVDGETDAPADDETTAPTEDEVTEAPVDGETAVPADDETVEPSAAATESPAAAAAAAEATDVPAEETEDEAAEPAADLPAAGEFTVSEDGRTMVWNVGELAPGQKVSAVLTATVQEGATAENIGNDIYISADGDERPESPGEVNETVEEDEDNYDGESFELAPEPTPEPTDEPTEEPTPDPEPTEDPTPEPTEEPTETLDPTEEPTETPAPTEEPTESPEPTTEPTPDPTTPAPAPADDNVDKGDPENTPPAPSTPSTVINTGIDQAKENPGAAIGIGALVIGSIAAGGFLLRRSLKSQD